MIEYKSSIDSFEDLVSTVWAGAVDTVQAISFAGKEEELMEFLEIIVNHSIELGTLPTLTEINDLLWHESEHVFSQLGMEVE